MSFHYYANRMVHTHASLGIDWNLLLGAERRRNENLGSQEILDRGTKHLGMTEHQSTHAHSDEGD